MISVNIVVNVVVLVSSGITLNCIRQFFRVIIHLLGKTYQQTMYGLIRTKALVLPRFFFLLARPLSSLVPQPPRAWGTGYIHVSFNDDLVTLDHSDDFCRDSFK